MSYKDDVIAYLKKHKGEDVSRKDLMEKYHIPKSSLSEAINMLRSEGHNIETPPRSGKVRLIVDESLNDIPNINADDVYQWLILYVLSLNGALSFVEIIGECIGLNDPAKPEIFYNKIEGNYDNGHIIKVLKDKEIIDSSDNNSKQAVAKKIISVDAVRINLNTLIDMGYVEIISKKSIGNKTKYKLTKKAPFEIKLSEDSLFILAEELDILQTTATNQLTGIKSRINKLIDYDEFKSQSRFGTSINISEEQNKALNNFVNYNYENYQLEFCVGDNSTKRIKFETGLIYYSVETNEFYVLGKNISRKKHEIVSYRLNNIKEIKQLDLLSEKNKEEYKSIYDEIFSSGYEGATKIKVLVEDIGNVKTRFEMLRRRRENTAKLYPIEPISHKKYTYSYVYEDTIRGLSAFARFLRGFGPAVVVMEPESLRETMMKTCDKVINQ